jgi:hypothetical protein
MATESKENSLVTKTLVLSSHWDDISFSIPSMDPGAIDPGAILPDLGLDKFNDNDGLMMVEHGTLNLSKSSQSSSPDHPDHPDHDHGESSNIHLLNADDLDRNDDDGLMMVDPTSLDKLSDLNLELRLKSNKDGHSGDEDAAIESLFKLKGQAPPKIKLKYLKKKYPESRKRYRQTVKVRKGASKSSITAIKSMLPGVSGKIDKAGAVETATKYVEFMQEKLNSDFRAEFLSTIIKK